MWLQQNEQQDLVTALIVVCFIVMAMDVLAPEIVFLIALVVLNLSEVLNLPDTLAGFANDSLVTIGSLFLVIGGVEKGHIIDYCSRKAFGIKSSYFWGRLRMYVSSFLVSAWFNNIPQVAIMIPIVQDWAELRGHSASKLLMPLSYTVLAGGMLATIGTSTNLIINGLMDQSKFEKFNFFDPAVVGVPAGMAVIAYMMIAGEFILPKNTNQKSGPSDRLFTHVLELTVEKGNAFIGQTVGDALANLGIRLKNLVKIRKVKKDIIHVITNNKEGSVAEAFKVSEYISTKYEVKGVEEEHTQLPAFLTNLLRPYTQLTQSYNDFHSKSWSRMIDDYLPRFFMLPKDYMVVKEKYASLPKDSYEDIYGNPDEKVEEGDIIFIGSASSSIERVVTTMPWERHNFRLYGNVEIVDLPTYGDTVVEVVLSDESPFINMSMDTAAAAISSRYKSLIISARDKQHTTGWYDALHGLTDSHHVYLTAGSSLLFLTTKENYRAILDNSEFASASEQSKLKTLPVYWHFFPLAMFLCIVSLVAAEQIEMCPAALAMAAFLFVGGWLQEDDITEYIDLRLLMLLGTSFSFAKAMTSTGLATSLAKKLSKGITSPYTGLWTIYTATLIMTEVISNNAAAVLMYPIGVALAKEQGVSYKPFAMIVMQAASMAFMCPIGYPTHIMVWRPGKYKFNDFCKFGFIPNIIWLVLSCLIVPAVWTFDEDV